MWYDDDAGDVFFFCLSMFSLFRQGKHIQNKQEKALAQ